MESIVSDLLTSAQDALERAAAEDRILTAQENLFTATQQNMLQQITNEQEARFRMEARGW
jgi:hypothetical protein